MAKEEKIEQEEAQPNQGKKKGSALKWIAIGGVGLMVLAAAGGGGWYYLNKVQSAKKETAKAPAIGTLWPMEPFIVNLADSNGERYLKLVIQLEVSDPLCIAELDQLKPKLRDNVLDLLSVKTFKELIELAGKQKLREEMVMRLNSFLTKGKIDKVYFTEFVIQ